MQVMAESRATELEDHLRRARTQVEDQARQLQDANSLKARLGQENLELHRHLQDLDTGNAALSKAKTALQQELEQVKMKLDDETRVTHSFILSFIHQGRRLAVGSLSTCLSAYRQR